MQAIPCRPRRPLPSPRSPTGRQAEENLEALPRHHPERHQGSETELAWAQPKILEKSPIWLRPPTCQSLPSPRRGRGSTEVALSGKPRGSALQMGPSEQTCGGFGMPRGAHAASVIAGPGASRFPARRGEGPEPRLLLLHFAGLRRDEKRKDAGTEPCAEGAARRSGRAGRKGASATVRLPSTPGAVAPAAAQC
jgi:hypothetical protein